MKTWSGTRPIILEKMVDGLLVRVEEKLTRSQLVMTQMLAEETLTHTGNGQEISDEDPVFHNLHRDLTSL